MQITARNITHIKLPNLYGFNIISTDMNNINYYFQLLSLMDSVYYHFENKILCKFRPLSCFIFMLAFSLNEVNSCPQASLFWLPIIRREKLDFSFFNPANPSERCLALNSKDSNSRFGNELYVIFSCST